MALYELTVKEVIAQQTAWIAQDKKDRIPRVVMGDIVRIECANGREYYIEREVFDWAKAERAKMEQKELEQLRAQQRALGSGPGEGASAPGQDAERPAAQTASHSPKPRQRS